MAASPIIMSNIIPVSHNNKFIFIGPRRHENHFCFRCFKDRLVEVGLDKHYMGYDTTDDLNGSEQDIVNEFKKKLASDIEVPSIYIFNRETYEVEIHSTFKRGDCGGCFYDRVDISHKKAEGGFTKTYLRQETFSSVEGRLEKFKTFLFSNKTSLINHLTRAGDSYGTPMVQSEVLYKGISMLSYGRTSTYRKSKYTSILESMERYATAFPYSTKDNNPLREEESSLIDLTLTEVMHLCNYNNSQNYTKNDPIYYQGVEALHKGTEVLIPEQLIYFNSHQVSGEKRYIYESSNGSALGSSVDEASLHAMLELFERDAFLATWYGRIPPVRIDLDEITSTKVSYYIEALKRKRIKVHLFEISVELKIPTIWVLLEKENPKEDEMAFYTAAAASFDLEDALEKALIEATTAISVFNNMFKRSDFLERKRYLLTHPHMVSELEDHLLLYSNKEMKEVLSFALNTSHSMTDKELTEYYVDYSGQSSKIIKKLQEKILEISPKAYRATIKNPNLTVTGFVNVKYIVPEMLTMTFGHQNRRVVYSRVEKAINEKKRGCLNNKWIENTPHPFP